jgi:hypothetical protein
MIEILACRIGWLRHHLSREMRVLFVVMAYLTLRNHLKVRTERRYYGRLLELEYESRKSLRDVAQLRDIVQILAFFTFQHLPFVHRKTCSTTTATTKNGNLCYS